MHDDVDRWARAIWDSSSLKPLQRLVALAFADHARSEVAWVSLDDLTRCTGMSRTAARDHLRLRE